MKRRAFLGAAAAITLTGRAQAQVGSDPSVQTPSLLSAWAERDVDGVLQYRVGRTDAVEGIALRQRAHGVVSHSTQPDTGFVVARRPGEYLLRVDLVHCRVEASVETDESFRFEGHAIVDSARGRVYATEADLITGEGRIGVFKDDTLERIATWPSGGIGPHELIALNTDVIAVANGGILTLPETGRVKRNLDRMTPSMVLLDATDGAKLAEFTLPDRRAGIRHLAMAADGTLGVALQLEGEAEQPLLAVLRAGELRFAESPSTPEPLARYGAGLAACGDRFAVACTHGHCIAVWDSAGRFIGRTAMRSPSGVVATGDRSGWIASNALGELVMIDVETRQANVIAHSERLWDNHLART